MRERRRLSFAGMIAVSLAVDETGALVGGPDVRACGVAEDHKTSIEAILDQLADVAEQRFDSLGRRTRKDPDAIEEEIRLAVRREINAIWGKKPQVDVMVLPV